MDLDTLLDAIVNSAQVRFGLPYVTVMWIDAAAGEFYLRAQAGPLLASAIPNFRQKLTEGLAAEVLRTGQPYLARDTRHEPAYIPPVRAEIRSLLLAPLKVAGQVIGVMTFESLGVDAFSAEDVTASDHAGRSGRDCRRECALADDRSARAAARRRHPAQHARCGAADRSGGCGAADQSGRRTAGGHSRRPTSSATRSSSCPSWNPSRP